MQEWKYKERLRAYPLYNSVLKESLSTLNLMHLITKKATYLHTCYDITTAVFTIAHKGFTYVKSLICIIAMIQRAPCTLKGIRVLHVTVSLRTQVHLFWNTCL